LCDTFQVPKPLSPQLLPFGKSDDDLGELTFEVGLFSSLFVRRGQSARDRWTVREELFFECSSCSCSASLSIHFGFVFWWKWFRTVRSNGRADDPRVPGGQSACSPRTVRYSGLSLEVLVAISDGPQRRAGQSAVWVRTVCGRRPDGPRGSSGQSAPSGRTVRPRRTAWFFDSIPSSFFRASACASRNRSSDLGLIHNLVVLAIGV
jgi:hypothetical protein